MDEETINSIIEKKTWIVDASSKLSSLKDTSFQSLILDVLEKRALSHDVKEINKDLRENPFVSKCDVDQKTFLRFDSLAYDLLPDNYQSLELSPLEPFAVNQYLGWISQKRIFSTTRNSEVISDPTMALSLHAAQQRIDLIKKNGANPDIVSLATSHRVIRQETPKKKWYTTHFRNFTIVSAWRDKGSETFEKQQLTEHFSYFIDLLDKLNKTWEYNIEDITFVISNVDRNKPELLDIVQNSVINDLSSKYPNITFRTDKDRTSNYYSSLCYSIIAKNKDWQQINIGWGGLTDRTKKLVGSKKERLLVWSIWSEIINKLFKS